MMTATTEDAEMRDTMVEQQEPATSATTTTPEDQQSNDIEAQGISSDDDAAAKPLVGEPMMSSQEDDESGKDAADIGAPEEVKDELLCEPPLVVVAGQSDEEAEILESQVPVSVDKQVSHGHDDILSIDPFAPRKGVTLSWRRVNMTLATKKNKEDKPRELLDNVSGQVPRQQTTAILGPSGAGKTSLLNILAGRSSTNNKVTIDAEVRVDGVRVDPTDIEVRKQIAFVAQDDSLERTATPREAIKFSAKLRLPKTFTELQLDELTNRMLEEVGLTHCADTIIGGGLMKGISGGERKRTSVGVELVCKPALVFLDEPTSGLDAFSAMQLCQVLKKVANAGASVLFTVHQPNSEIFNSFDHVLLLNKGRLMYEGQVNDVASYFSTRGYPVPPNYSTADWIMTVAQANSMEKLEHDQFFERSESLLTEATSESDDNATKTALVTTTTNTNHKSEESHVSFGTEARLLYQREIKAIYRNTGGTIARFGVTSILALLIGMIFFDVGNSPTDDPNNVFSSFGALVIVGITAMMGSAQAELMAFPMTRPVFLREYSTNHYSVFSYFIARFSIEATLTALQNVVMCVITYFMIGFHSNFLMFYLAVYAVAMSSTAISVFLGCIVEDENTAKELFPILTVPQMLFAGFFVSPDLIPPIIRWAQWLCALTHSVRILLITEFNREDCDNCQAMLKSVDANPNEIWKYWIGLLAIFFGYRLMGLFFLQRKGKKFY